MSTKETPKHSATTTLIGTLLEDPVVKSDKDPEKAPAKLVVGVTRKYKQGDEDKESTAKHHAKAWGGCKSAAMKLRKGDEVKVVGEPRNEMFEPEGDDGKPTGEKRFFTTVNVDDKSGGVVERL